MYHIVDVVQTAMGRAVLESQLVKVGLMPPYSQVPKHISIYTKIDAKKIPNSICIDIFYRDLRCLLVSASIIFLVIDVIIIEFHQTESFKKNIPIFMKSRKCYDLYF